ncbi:MAG TPA: HEAT repeat domain-containing protein [Polyangiaceae bacterium]|nr:HEAT repeat domain-containing protein [Polyangiaceae bacterium]
MASPVRTLAHALDDPGFVPGAAHFEALFALLASASREEAPRLERVLARGGEHAVRAVLAELPQATPAARARLVSVLGRIADPRATDALRGALGDADPLVVRRAATALGKLPHDPRAEADLRAAWPRADLVLRRALAEALGKVGGPDAAALLRAEQPSDPELGRVVAKALLLLERRASRDTPSRIRTSAPLGVTLPVLAECRPGLAELLAQELGRLGRATVRSPSLVELPFAGRFDALFTARTALGFGVRVALERASDAELPDAVARALASETARAALAAWTEGAPRYRLSFSEGGHQRAGVFRIVEAARARVPELVNDSRSASWEVVVVRGAPEPYLVLAPLAFEDPRFSYRKREVRAASHPTIAAALARAAGAEPGDVIWDPFVGSGLELVERAKLGPYRALLGSDVDPDALAAASENLAAAAVHAELRLGSATELRPDGVSLILTNPPMGRRLVRDRTLGTLLDAFVAHAARVLVPGGRVVWLSPLPERTRRVAEEVGLRARAETTVDMGGFEAELQRLQKR